MKRNRHRKNLLTSIEKRKLGLQNLPKNLKYKSFTKLHKAWQTYIEGFLNLDVRYIYCHFLIICHEIIFNFTTVHLHQIKICFILI